MCLTVTHVPTSSTSCLVYHGYKHLCHKWRRRTYTTPHQGTGVPADGWLIPRTYQYYSPDHYWSGQRITTHHIHFYTREKEFVDAKPRQFHRMAIYPREAWGEAWRNDMMVPCFAINVRAFETVEHIESMVGLPAIATTFNQTTLTSKSSIPRIDGSGVATAVYIPACDTSGARATTLRILLNVPQTGIRDYLQHHFPHLRPYLHASKRMVYYRR